MSDPLTALMHAVQVMNLLKTLIVKTLRERDEGAGGDYSPLSCRTSERQTEEEYDSQQDMDTSCESASDDEDQAQYSPCSEEKDEVESLSEIEESFLRQLNENEDAKNGFRKQLEGILCRESPMSVSTYNADSSVSFSTSKTESSCLTTSDGEDSRTSIMARTPLNMEKVTNDLEMVESV